jgi:hypothetical protein
MSALTKDNQTNHPHCKYQTFSGTSEATHVIKTCTSTALANGFVRKCELSRAPDGSASSRLKRLWPSPEEYAQLVFRPDGGHCPFLIECKEMEYQKACTN